MGQLLLRLLKFFLAACFLPFVVAVTMGFSKQLGNLREVNELFLLGIFCFTLLHLFLYSPLPVFHFGQKLLEDTFRFSPPLASVIPAVFPFYTVIMLLLLYVLNALMGFNGDVVGFFMFMTGFCLTMHVVLSAQDLYDEDPGKFKAHYLFSMSLVYILVIFITSLFMSINFGKFSFSHVVKEFGETALSIYAVIFDVFRIRY